MPFVEIPLMWGTSLAAGRAFGRTQRRQAASTGLSRLDRHVCKTSRILPEARAFGKSSVWLSLAERLPRSGDFGWGTAPPPPVFRKRHNPRTAERAWLRLVFLQIKSNSCFLSCAQRNFPVDNFCAVPRGVFSQDIEFEDRTFFVPLSQGVQGMRCLRRNSSQSARCMWGNVLQEQDQPESTQEGVPAALFPTVFWGTHRTVRLFPVFTQKAGWQKTSWQKTSGTTSLLLAGTGTVSAGNAQAVVSCPFALSRALSWPSSPALRQEHAAAIRHARRPGFQTWGMGHVTVAAAVLLAQRESGLCPASQTAGPSGGARTDRHCRPDRV